MYEEIKRRSYKVSFFVFLIMIISSVFVMISAFGQEGVCIFEKERSDLMEGFDGWIPHELEREGVWDSGVDVPLNDEGYPRVVPFKSGLQEYVVKTILTGDEKFLKDGLYTFSFKGKGKPKIGFDAEEKIFSSPGEYDVLVIGTGKGIYIEIMESSIEDPIRDIHFYVPIEKELRNCGVNESGEIEGINGSEYISDPGLVHDNETDLKPYENKSESKFIRGLIILFAIFAVIYILK